MTTAVSRQCAPIRSDWPPYCGLTCVWAVFVPHTAHGPDLPTHLAAICDAGACLLLDRCLPSTPRYVTPSRHVTIRCVNLTNIVLTHRCYAGLDKGSRVMALLNEDEQTTNYLQIRFQPRAAVLCLSTIFVLGVMSSFHYTVKYIMS